MRLEQLEYIVAVIESESISLAARKLHTSQQNISRAIRQLEDELNLTLLKRSKKGVKATEECEILCQHARMALSHIKAITELSHTAKSSQSPNDLAAKVTILSLPGIYNAIFNVVKAINKDYPNIEIVRHEMESSAINAQILQEDNEIVFTSLCMEELNNKDAIAEKYDIFLLNKEPLKLYVSLASTMVNYKKISLKKLADLPLAVYYSDSQKTPFILDLLKNHNVKPKNIIKTQTPEFCSEYILDGSACYLGTSYILANSNKCDLNKLHTINLNQSIYISHVLLVKKEQRTLAASIFLQYFLTLFPNIKQVSFDQ